MGSNRHKFIKKNLRMKIILPLLALKWWLNVNVSSFHVEACCCDNCRFPDICYIEMFLFQDVLVYAGATQPLQQRVRVTPGTWMIWYQDVVFHAPPTVFWLVYFWQAIACLALMHLWRISDFWDAEASLELVSSI